jgi:hypothetical protein
VDLTREQFAAKEIVTGGQVVPSLGWPAAQWLKPMPPLISHCVPMPGNNPTASQERA